MENYIDNIVEDMQKYIKINPKATPEEAWRHVIDMVESAAEVEPRKHWHIAKAFVDGALLDKELRQKALEYIDGYIYKCVVLFDCWNEFDAELYSMVALIKKDEIIDRVKALEK